MRHFLTVVACLLTIAPPASAGQLPDVVTAQLQLFLKTHDPADLIDVTGTDLVSAYILDRVLESERPDQIDLSEIRQDLQGGSLSMRSGGTSVIARPSLTDLMNAALETGAIGRKTNDKSVTFSVNALPLKQLLSGELPRGCGSLDADCRRGSGRWLRGLSTSVSLSPSTAATAVPETGENTPAPTGFRIGGRVLQVAAIRYELLVRERDSAALQKALDEASAALQEKASAFLKNQAEFENTLGALLEPEWKQETLALLERNANSLERLTAVLHRRYEAAYEMVRGNAALQAIHASTVRETLAYISTQNALLAEKLYRKALTADYLHERPTDQPPLHNVRMVFSTPLGRKSSAIEAGAVPDQAAPTGMLTINGGMSFFDPATDEESGWRVRDGQFSLGLDWSPRVGGRLRPTYTAAYYFQYMVSNGVLQFTGDAVTPGGAAIELPKAAKELLDTKGPIHVAQVRVRVPVGNGVSFPVALSYSNRSELIKGRSFWQGHFGVTYDFSQLRKLAGN